MAPPWEGGTKNYIKGSGHMTKMAARPIYDKKPLKNFFSRTGSPMILKLGMHRHRDIDIDIDIETLFNVEYV